MAEKKPTVVVKINLPGGTVTAGPPLGSSLGPTGVNLGAFVKQFNEATASQKGVIIPTIIKVYADRSFSFVTKTPPATYLIKKAAGVQKGSGKPNSEKVGSITKSQAREIAQQKLPDLNANDIEAATSIIEGSARSMGITVVDDKAN